MSMIPGETLKFIRAKEYTFQRNIGQGGTGKTILVKDEVTNISLVCKKYYPHDIDKKKEYFNRFIDEIKIMYLSSHKNIVRIYSYFLYPEHTTGYILMEYIDGLKIDEFLFLQDNDVFENIFMQLIEGFEYLEINKILHRDIRNENILVTNDGVVKIIDFGFGKKIEGVKKENASILLNWPVSDLPEEINHRLYDHQTEIYFVGKLFNKLLENSAICDFRYQHIIEKMIIVNQKNRVKSFTEVLQSLSEDIFVELDFTDDEKSIYLVFIEKLVSNINFFKNEFSPITDPKQIIGSLENVIKDSLLENILQNNSSLISCFINNNYNYYSYKDILIDDIRSFYKFIKMLSPIKQRILLNNITVRLELVPIKNDDDDIPF